MKGIFLIPKGRTSTAVFQFKHDIVPSGLDDADIFLRWHTITRYPVYCTNKVFVVAKLMEKKILQTPPPLPLEMNQLILLPRRHAKWILPVPMTNFLLADVPSNPPEQEEGAT